MTVVLLLVSLLAVAANAEITKMDPASGEVEPGGTMTADIAVSVSGLLSTTCLTASSDAPLDITVTFDELLACGGSRIVGMTVEVTETIAPGDYSVTIQEVDLEGSLLNTYDWPLTVFAPSTTTTSSTTTTTTSSTTTTTSTSSTTTTSTSTTTTTTSASSTTSTTDTTSSTTTTTSTSSGNTSSPTTTADNSSTTTDSSTSSTDSENEAVGPSEEAAAVDDGTGAVADGESAFSETAFSTGLREIAGRALPPVFAEAVISPLVILEVLLRSLARTVWSLLLPLGMTTVLGVGMIWRLRVDPESLEDHQIGINGEGDGS